MENIIYVDTIDKLDESLEYLNKKSLVGFDTETNGLDPHINDILLIQVGDTYKQFVFDVYQLGDSIYQVVNYLNRSDVEKIGHFMQFDYGMMKTNFGVDLPNLICTHVGSQLLTKGIMNVDNSLEGCLNKYLRVRIDKKEQKSFEGMKLGEPFTKGQIKYSGKDVEHLIPLHREIQTLLDQREMRELSLLEYETVRVCGDLEVNGIFLDKDMWISLKDKAWGRVSKAKKELDSFFIPYCNLDIFGEPNINYNSPLQLRPLLSKIIGKELPDTSAETLEYEDHEAITALLNYREAAKKISTYGDEFVRKHIHPKTGRVHSNFRQLGTDSGRMASRDPNMQNIPSEEEYRFCFRVKDPTTHKMISADFSG